jgi:hypothetical protein
VAVSAIMSHVDNSMAGNYRERISDERLVHVVGLSHGGCSVDHPRHLR